MDLLLSGERPKRYRRCSSFFKEQVTSFLRYQLLVMRIYQCSICVVGKIKVVDCLIEQKSVAYIVAVGMPCSKLNFAIINQSILVYKYIPYNKEEEA